MIVVPPLPEYWKQLFRRSCPRIDPNCLVQSRLCIASVWDFSEEDETCGAVVAVVVVAVALLRFQHRCHNHNNYNHNHPCLVVDGVLFSQLALPHQKAIVPTLIVLPWEEMKCP